jgi:hypothetical protein
MKLERTVSQWRRRYIRRGTSGDKGTGLRLSNLHDIDVLHHLDILRPCLCIAMTTIRKVKHNQKVDTDAVLRRLALIRAEAKEIRDSAKIATHGLGRFG